VALTPAVRAKIDSLGGNVRYLVAPDIEHHIFLSEWARAFPGAKLIGPEGLPEKRHKVADAGSDPQIGREEFAVVVTRDNARRLSVDDEFDRDFEVEYVHAHPNRELVFVYKPDRVLIEADLMFNLPAIEQYSRVPEEQKPKQGLIARLATGIQSIQGDATGAKRLNW
jgi:glyoxylase-like metal-dependent hydrolase (beta-lactamase superfamily II)